jgi:hypothetical protein
MFVVSVQFPYMCVSACVVLCNYGAVLLVSIFDIADFRACGFLYFRISNVSIHVCV